MMIVHSGCFTSQRLYILYICDAQAIRKCIRRTNFSPTRSVTPHNLIFAIPQPLHKYLEILPHRGLIYKASRRLPLDSSYSQPKSS